jgi:UDP-N-acetylglucosamine 2-epimerase (hydrolysing)
VNLYPRILKSGNHSLKNKKIGFLTGTRADYGKIKPLISALDSSFEVVIFATGMHLLSQYGNTIKHVLDDGLARVVTFSNQELDANMEDVLSETIRKLAEVIRSEKIDLLVVHGDRVEAMAGALTGALMNLRIAHVEGGEISGTVDNLLRHSISKLSQHHFVSNHAARETLLNLGESPSQIFVIGSPDLDIMASKSLPSMNEVRDHYDLFFAEYGILLFHPITTEINSLHEQISELVESIEVTDFPWVIIQPNNDLGSAIVRRGLERLTNSGRFKHIPSMRFEYFLVLLENSKLIVGNSSAGIREAPFYGVPTVNVGSRQRNRLNMVQVNSVINCTSEKSEITLAIDAALKLDVNSSSYFGEGDASRKFNEILLNQEFWEYPLEKLDSRH